ncbi:MAG TPA: class I SAM-dependent methyltransferase [Candidatus Limnocylindrales bacterium]
MSTEFDRHERLRWSGRARAYERSFAKLCAHPAGDLLDAARVGAGTRILDAGTGSGTVARLAADRTASVTAVDAEPDMVALARRNVPEAEVRQGVLPDLPFPDGEFDAAVANFVLNHTGDPVAALAELRRVTRSGGRIAVTIWPYPQMVVQTLWAQAIRESGVVPPADLPRLAPEHEFERSEAGLTSLLRRAGLTDVTCRRLEWLHRTDFDDWWSGPAAGLGTPGLIIAAQAPQVVARIRLNYERLCEPYREPGNMLALPAAALLAAGEA